ncbi:MAG: glycosyltransferase [Chitinophagaceae bacterium]|nr:MAG: glycosyltransferase [Chitinophagaceae bacterium]
MDRHLHIISLDVPYPVDFGGVFDIYYKLVALHAAGVKIHLHCFQNKREQQPQLDQYCESVRYYPRQTGHKGVSYRLPYIVSSRSSAALAEQLLLDDYPILVEGIHCTHFLMDDRFAKRNVILRLHNVETTYYQHLYKSAAGIFKKLYYRTESRLLKEYETEIVKKVSLILTVSSRDKDYYRECFGAKSIANLPVFLGFSDIKSETGVGCYCLYHGNLSVPENEKAAMWLVSEVFSDISVPLVIAGKNPSEKLTRFVRQHQHCCVVADPGENELADMIAKAHIHVLPSMNETGVKLKLLNALYNGRHAVVNEAGVAGTGFESACHIAGNAAGFKSIVTQLYHKPFTDDEINLRKRLLSDSFNNQQNAGRLIGWIWK